MKRLTTYINESQFIDINLELIQNTYDDFNIKYFGMKLPDSEEIVLKYDVIKGHQRALGLFGFEESWYYSRRRVAYDHYIMYKNKQCTIEYDSIKELRPYILISKNYNMTQEQFEDTLLHEMIHFYTYKDCYAPKQAHGKEFRAMCNKLRKVSTEKYGKHYKLTIYADIADNTFEFTNKQLDASREKRRANTRTNAIGIYVKSTKYPEHFLFTNRTSAPKILQNVYNGFEHRGEPVNDVYIAANVYERVREKYGDFRIFNKYRCYYCDRFPDVKDYIIRNGYKIDFEHDDLSTILNKIIIKESHENMEDIIYVTPDTNLSVTDIEDIDYEENTTFTNNVIDSDEIHEVDFT